MATHCEFNARTATDRYLGMNSATPRVRESYCRED